MVSSHYRLDSSGPQLKLAAQNRPGLIRTTGVPAPQRQRPTQLTHVRCKCCCGEGGLENGMFFASGLSGACSGRQYFATLRGLCSLTEHLYSSVLLAENESQV